MSFIRHLLCFKRPPLALAAASGWRRGVKALLAVKEERRVNIDAADEQVPVVFVASLVLPRITHYFQGATAIFWAAEANQPEIFKLLLDAGASLDCLSQVWLFVSHFSPSHGFSL
jgi:hypothetical protein